MRILTIDDEGWVTDTLTAYLTRQYHTVSTLTYVEGREELRSHLDYFNPEGVIIDFEMEPQGDHVYGWLRQWCSSLRIVFYTKYADSPQMIRRMTAVGASKDEIIQKTEIGLDVPSLIRALERPSAEEERK